MSLNAITASNDVDNNDVVGPASVYSTSTDVTRPMSVEGRINNVLVGEILVDTGASITAVSSNLLRRLQIDTGVLAPVGIKVRTASATALHPLGTINLMVHLRDVPIGEMKFIALDNLNADAILGADAPTKFFDTINLKRNILTFKDRSIPLNICSRSNVDNMYRDVCEVFSLHGISIPPFEEVITTDTSVRGNLIVYQDDVLIKKEDGNDCVLVEPILIPGLERKFVLPVACWRLLK